MGCLFPKQNFTENNIKKSESNSTTNGELGPDVFNNIKVIGRGSFGKVILVSKKDTDQYYAMKVLKKRMLAEKDQVEHTLTERRILEYSNCPFVVKLHFAFQTSSKVYLVMEYLAGGELFYHLSQNRIFSESRSRFYISEILIGLEYLHNNAIIYRDLKPENVLLDSLGHIRLTDFGLSKSGLTGSKKSQTFCGTPEYVAPEIIMNLPYTKAVDFWSLGALLYYMLSGSPPFYSTNKSEVFKNVLVKDLEPLLSLSDAANDLISKLLQKDPLKRISSAEEVKTHQWFEGYDWDIIASKKMEPPFKPREREAKGKFDKNLGVDESIESVDPKLGTMRYSGFTYKDQFSHASKEF